MDNVGIVVDDLPATIAFFRELGLELEGRAMVEGEWAGRVTGLGDQRVEIAMMRTPDGHSRLELSRFLAPPVVADHRNAPVNALGYLRVMFAVDDIDDTLARLRSTARSSSAAKWSSTKTRFGSATSAGLKAFSLGSLKNSAERRQPLRLLERASFCLMLRLDRRRSHQGRTSLQSATKRGYSRHARTCTTTRDTA
jgi:catechol 2,3-dioxygenase-like lactoylglutathione lyase family enzyme